MDFPFADQAFRSACCKDYGACKSTDQQTVQFKRREKKKCKRFYCTSNERKDFDLRWQRSLTRQQLSSTHKLYSTFKNNPGG